MYVQERQLNCISFITAVTNEAVLKEVPTLN